MAGQADSTDILAGINQVIVAINDKIFGGGGSCGCGPESNPVIAPPAAEGQPSGGGGPGGNGVPPGYPGSIAEYSVYKCKAANYIFDDAHGALVFIGSMGTIAGGITAGSLFGTWLLGQLALAGFGTVGAGGVILFASVAAWEIAAIVALIAVVTLVAGSAVVVVFTAMASDFLAKKDDVVCGMYNAQTVEDAQDVLTDALADSTLTFTISAPYDTWEAQIRTMMSDVIDYFAPTTTFNKLFEEDEAVDNYTAGTVDCATCDACPDYYIYWGNIVSFTETDLEMTSEWNGSYHVCSLAFHVTGIPWADNVCGPECEFTVVSLTGRTPAAGVTDFKMSNELGISVYNSETPPTIVSDVLYFIFYSATSYTLVADLVFE